MDASAIVPLIMRWIHVLSAVIAVGGAIFMRFVLMPSAKAMLTGEQHEALRAEVVRRWKRLVHVCIGLLLISGFYNYLAITRFEHVDQAIYHALFGIKFLLALAVFALAIGLTSGGRMCAGLRKQSVAWMGVLVLLAVGVVLLSGVLRSLPDVPVVNG